MTRLASRLSRDDRGTAIIELALVAPMMALVIVGIIDLSNAYSHKLALEQGAQRAIEKIMQTTEEDTVENTLATEAICQVNGLNPDGTCKSAPLTTANVVVTWRLECTDGSNNTTVQTNTVASTFDTYSCPSGTVRQAKYVQVSINDTYTPMFPIHFAALNADGTYHMGVNAGMRWQ